MDQCFGCVAVVEGIMGNGRRASGLKRSAGRSLVQHLPTHQELSDRTQRLAPAGVAGE